VNFLNILNNLRLWLASLLRLEPAQPKQLYVRENLTFEDNCALNRIWYHGDPEEFSQIYSQLGGAGFWSMSAKSRKIPKIHTGLPALIVDTLSQIVISDMLTIEISDSPAEQELLHKILEKNQFPELLEQSVSDTLIDGDGAFKITFHPEKSEFPALEFFSGNRVQYENQEIIFLTKYLKNSREFLLRECYGFGYVRYILTDASGIAVSLDSLDETRNLTDLIFDKNIRLAVPLKFRKSKRYPNRGQSIFDRKRGCFDALDESWSQYMGAVRKSQPKTYIPSALADYNPQTGEPMRPDPFEDNYIITGSNMAEDGKNQITSVQPEIQTECYLSAYMTALDLCLQGLISPSTLGIDVKKLDNAEAQREKEKATLYTRNRIITVLQKILPELFQAVLWTYYAEHELDFPEHLKISVPWGEYANPSFESQVETIGKAKSSRIMSNEAVVEELYGDTKPDDWKQAEIERLNQADGLILSDEELF